LFSSFVSFDFVFDCFKCCIIVRYNTFSFVSINLHSQASKQASKILPEKQKNVETLSESFTSRGKARLQYRVTASAQNLKDKNQLNTKMWPKPESMLIWLRAQTRNQLDSINFTSLHRHSLGATRRTKAAAIFNETNNHIDHHMPPLLPTPANEKH
jgi:hypothetical protein